MPSPLPRSRFGLGWKIFVGTACTMLVVLVWTLWLTIAAGRDTAGAVIDRALDQTLRTASTFLAGDARSLAQGARVFVQNPSFRSLLLAPKSGDVLDQAEEAAVDIGASWVQITDANGVRLARSDDRAAPSVSLASSPLIERALAGKSAHGYGVSADSELFQAVAVPIETQVGGGGSVIGALMASKRVDDTLARAVRQATKTEVVFVALDTSGSPHIAASTIQRSGSLDRAVQAAATSMRGERVAPLDVTLDGVRYFARSAPLMSAGGTELGRVVAFHSWDDEVAPFRDLRKGLTVAGLGGIALACLFSIVFARRVTRPVSALVAATRRATDGDYEHPITVTSTDEIGELATSFRTLLDNLRDKQALVEELGGTGATRESRRLTSTRPIPVPRSDGLALSPGELFAGRYEIVDVLGEGGMGVVYKAIDRDLGGDVIAIKTLRSSFLTSDGSALERFRSEIRLARRISHRNVVRTHDIGEADGVYFITMEFVSGTTLRELIAKRHQLSVPPTLTIGKQLARALEAAHAAGVIHRDIKPQNLAVQPDGVLKVMDFGVARLIERQRGMTQTGMVIGTPEYMAPEQLLGDPVDARVDIYASGVVLYECLVGERPWHADSVVALVGKMMSEQPPAPITRNDTVPQALSDLIVRAISRDPNARPPTATDLHDALAKIG